MQEKDIIFVEGEASRLGYKMIYFLLQNLLDGLFVLPKMLLINMTRYWKLAKVCITKYYFIIALGPTATILAYDLANAGYRALDLGHIDIEYEWVLMGAKKKVAIKINTSMKLKAAEKSQMLKTKII